MVEFVSGDFFDYVADVRINTVNCVGVMGAGVALAFKNKYPDMFKEYVRVCREGKIWPGNPHVWEERDLFSKCIIVNLPTKIHWRNPSEYEYIEKNLVWLQEFLMNQDEDIVVTLPALGCGHGGLNWNIVKEMIRHYLLDVRAKVLVFEPDSSNKDFAKAHFGMKLKQENIQVIYPDSQQYPDKLRGKSSVELYCKGNTALLTSKKISLICGNDISHREISAVNAVMSELPKEVCAYVIGGNNKKHIALAEELVHKGYRIILVVPYGISRVKDDFYVKEHPKNMLIVSYSKPTQEAKRYGYIVSHKFRVKLADAVLFSMDSLCEIEKITKYSKSNKNNFYINYWSDCVDKYDEIGAKRIGIAPKTKRPNVMALQECLENL